MGGNSACVNIPVFMRLHVVFALNLCCICV